ncbi:transporter substrate-binding domain-containing protein [Chitinibacter sp. SCUT-21]|uniref:substrate-binding periplasmic protein n=1 Tax=Chitinibacter sp. SCUT-21 TaxID=2970891 RepID=UPI0035A6B9ED
MLGKHIFMLALKPSVRALQHFALVLPFTLSIPLCMAEDLRAYTERFPPFNYQQDDGEPTGLAYEVMMLTAAKAKLKINTEFLPWPRAVKLNAEDANSILFTTVRTPPRETSYMWVGPFDPCDISLLKLNRRNDIQLKQISDAFRFNIGLPAFGADIETLTRLGFPAERLQKIPPSGNLAKMLFAQRFDMISGIQLSYAYEARMLGFSGSEITPAIQLKPGLGCYFAFNPKVDPNLYQRFSRAFQELVQDGSIQKLKAKYLQ